MDINQWLIQNNAFKNDKLNPGIIRMINKKSDIKKTLQDLTNSKSEDPAELLYRYKHPDCNNKCAICGAPTKFVKYYYGYNETCSAKCAHQLTSNKAKKTNLEKYGTENPLGNKDIREKAKQTSLEKYGDANYRNTEKIKQTKLNKYGAASYNNIDKAKQTCLNRYGVDNAMKSEEIQKRAKQTLLKKYGVEYASQTKRALEIQSFNKTNRFLEEVFKGSRLGEIEPLFTKEEFEGVSREHLYKFRCKKCGNIFEDHLNNGRIPVCKNCHPSEICDSSIAEKEILGFIKNIYKGIVTSNDRTIIHPLELDIYVPEKKLAIEFDGLYWHSNVYKKSNYHLMKTRLCESRGIHLIHIFEDEWKDKRDIICSIISSALGIYQNRVYARKCVIKEVPKRESIDFFNANHLQGNAPSSICLGLYFNNELISAISFAKPRFNKEYDYELIRYANKIGYTAVGGFNKLLSHFRSSYKGSILTYSDRRLFTGNIYRNSGFKELEPTSPDYWYIENEKRNNRMLYQKKILMKRFNESSDLTENQIAFKHGIYRIYGCGNWKFELK